jgi:hypothetical protein
VQYLFCLFLPVTSINQAYNTVIAIFAGDGALMQLCLFWKAPIADFILAEIVYHVIFAKE